MVKECKWENKFGHVHLTIEEGSLGMVSCGAWLYPCGQKRRRKHSFALKWSKLLPDLKGVAMCIAYCRLKRERHCIKNGNEAKAWPILAGHTAA